MRKFGALAAAALLTGACSASAQTVQSPSRLGPAQSPLATSVRVHGGSDIVYISGTVPDVLNPNAPAGSVERFGDTEAQTRTILNKLEAALAQQGMSLGDVVMMRVFLVAPPGRSGMDFAGMMKAYLERFGTTAQPNKPARSTMEVAGLVDPGWLVEIEVTAAGGPKRTK